ncbi:MAG: RNA polymerase sporulation sigma factor SigK [Clostridiaceae bacterium]|jgi:RNA polymerase sporulation-specific sigma factor|nr:RNA polymerase sporulation sigma factor SigK [Clostridiaceae bacterium]
MFSILSAVLSNMLFLMLHLENAGSFPKPLTAAQEREALEKMKQGDASARDKLVEHNLRLVVHIIKKYYANYSDQDDLISIGTIGLIKAVNSFDSDKGTRLATYASRCIENEILMYFRNQKKSAQDVSMNEPIDIDAQGNPLTLSEIIFTDDTIVDDIDKKLKLERLRQAVAGIEDPREKLIIVRRYGLDGRMPLTQREIAKQLNISRSYVSRIEKKVLHNLRKAFDGD